MGTFIIIAATVATAAIGGLFKPAAWYQSVTKPSWTPPNWVFAPVWTTLYILMAIAAIAVLRKSGFSGARIALSLFFLQLVLNALWSALFFGMQRPDLAFVDIVLMIVVITATMLMFWQKSTLAGALFVPYLLWVLYASTLNFGIWRMNP